MGKTLGTRFAIIALVVAFLGYKAYQGIFENTLEQGTDLKGGSELVFRFDFEGVSDGQKQELLAEAIDVVQQRVDNYGLKDIEITPLGNDRFSLQVSARDKEVVESIKELVSVLGNLEFRITVEPDGSFNYDKYWRQFKAALEKEERDAEFIAPEDLDPDDRSRAPLGLKWYRLSDRGQASYQKKRLPEGSEPWVLCVIDKWNVGSEALDSISYYRDTRGGFGSAFAVGFSVNRQWQSSMGALTDTSDDKDKYMAIILNGRVDSAPHLNNTLRSNGEITGGFTEEAAKKLAAVLQAGKLQQKPVLVSERTIAAELAGGARDRGVLSTMIAFGIVLVLMAYYYFGPGLLANLALLLNLVLLVGVLSWFEAVLTLPGIAGVVLTVGMAVDANILVFERIKEEKSKGRTVSQAVETGYDRALVTIIDANLTTLITAYFLFQIGSGPVRGFGITLAIGILVSMFTALYVTRTIFSWLMQKGAMTEAKMNGEFKAPRIDWMSGKARAVTISAVLMIGGTLAWEMVPEQTKYDLDFSEGSRLIVKFHEPATKAEVEEKIAELAAAEPAYGGVTVRVSAEGIGAAVAAGEGRVFEIRSQKISSEERIEAFKRDLRKAFSGKLLPGPFRATLEASPDRRLEGRIAFVRDDVEGVWVEEALDAYRRVEGVPRDPRVEEAESEPGAGATFAVSIEAVEDDKGNVDLAVDRALASFDKPRYEEALGYLEAEAANESNTEEQKKEFAARAAALMAAPLPEDVGNLFEQTDPMPSADRVDPFSARQHRDAAVNAIALSIIGIILYVAFRFRSWAFGFAAVVALVHDVLVVLGLVALFNLTGLVDARLNLVTVAAFLTLIGYSINDTIVVFDRIRENRGTGRARLQEILNKSINQTFRRTIRTTTTTWIVVTILFAFNLGSTSPLEGFAFILMIGVLVGTYSSIFIASPTLLFLPVLWEKCGKTVKGIFMRMLPYAAVSFVGLLAVEWRDGHLAGDWSRVGFTDAIIALPMGMLLYFIVEFVRFVRQPEEAVAEAA